MDELIAKLGLDWRLLLAQTVNFGLLLAVLSWALYRPLLKVMRERRENIERGLRDTAAAKQQLHELAAYRERQLAEFRRHADAMVAEAVALAEATKKAAVQTASEQAAKIMRQAHDAIAVRQEQMLDELRGQLADLVVQAAGKVLDGKLTDAQHRQLVADAAAALKQT